MLDADTKQIVDVLVVCDGARRWDWLVDTLGGHAGVRVLVAEGVPELAAAQAERHQPDIVIAAARHLLPGTSFLGRLLRSSPHCRMVALGTVDELTSLRVQTAEIRGMATWEEMSPRTAVVLVEGAAAGLRVLTPDLPVMLVETAGTGSLTHVEVDILNALNRRPTERDAMKECSLGRATFTRAIKSLKDKLQVASLFALGAEAAKRNLLDDGREAPASWRSQER